MFIFLFSLMIDAHFAVNNPLRDRIIVAIKSDATEPNLYSAQIPIRRLLGQELVLLGTHYLWHGANDLDRVTYFQLLQCFAKLDSKASLKAEVAINEIDQSKEIKRVGGKVVIDLEHDGGEPAYRIIGQIVCYERRNDLKPPMAIAGIELIVDRIDQGSSFRYTMTPRQRYVFVTPRK